MFGYLFSYFLCYKNKIFHADEILGKIADYYKLFIILSSCIIVIIEPVFNYNSYMTILKSQELFYEIVNDELQHKIKEKIKSKCIKIILSLFIFYMLCEILTFNIYFVLTETRYIYVTTNLAQIFLYLKVGHLLYHLITIDEFFEVIKEKVNSAELKPNRYKKILELYDLTKAMISSFNNAGLGLLAIFLGNKFYLVGEYYWLTLAFLVHPGRYGENIG